MDFSQLPEPNTTAAGADLMNDPIYATNTVNKGKTISEPDTCRICRSEGSNEEPLFYPCKCSGSIKFVHQACLMEWLSHSQKKYCELCKTAFQFTKLYDGSMPARLPVPVFLKELVLHTNRYIIAWLRLILVAFVWLGWLPWFMRAIWRGLFWLADGRWPNSSTENPEMTVVNHTLEALTATGTSPTYVLASDIPPASASNSTSALPSFLSSMLNFTFGDPLLYFVTKKIFFSTVTQSTPSSLGVAVGTAMNRTSTPRKIRQPSWLSDITFLSELTPYPTLNNIIIDTLEGQIITLSVVVSFIVLFLIREWVIQRQPLVNLDENELGPAAQQLLAEVPPVDNRPIEEDHIPPPEEQELEEDQEFQEGGEPETTREPSESQGLGEDRGFTRAETPGNPLSFTAGLSPIAHSYEFTDRFAQNLSVAHPETVPDVNPSTDQQDQESHCPKSQESSFQEASHHHNVDADTTWPDSGDVWTHGRGDPKEVAIIGDEAHTIGIARFASAVELSKSAEELLEHRAEEQSVPWESRLGTPNVSIADTEHASPSPLLSVPYKSEKSNDEAESSSSAVRSNGILSDSYDVDASESNQSLNDSVRPNAISNLLYDGVSSVVDSPEEVHDNDDPRPDDLQEEYRNIHRHREDEGGSNHAQLPNENTRNESQNNGDFRDTSGDKSFTETVADWFWGNLNPEDREDDHEEDAEFFGEPDAFDPDNPEPLDVNDERVEEDFGVGAADEVIDDGDDIEGLLELIGMRGPIFGLLQNGVFSALLVSFTVTLGIWLPYLWGKIALVLLTNPIRLFVGIPLALISVIADVTVDTLIGSIGYVGYFIDILLQMTIVPVAKLLPFAPRFFWDGTRDPLSKASLSLVSGSGYRLKRVLGTFFNIGESDLPIFSVISHQALRMHQSRVATAFWYIMKLVRGVFYDIPLLFLDTHGRAQVVDSVKHFDPVDSLRISVGLARTLKSGIFMEKGKWFVARAVSLAESRTSIPFDYDLAHWDTQDRLIAIAVGYCFISFMVFAYLHIISLANPRNDHSRGGAIAEGFQQAGGVMKVILIIGIEMLIFPLYCGILLDVALLPLFESKSFGSRITFTARYPGTSLFLHWFIGTCYMFHFALFVSMCRRIMRTGVLYFIRDPDDPTFHPVRDVLERNISTQLRKIAFSALIYGALVIVCLGGVVWGIAYIFSDVLPLRWSGTQHVLEVPVDLLFYNMVAPLVVRYIKPSDRLNAMYDWWFHRCAHILRISQFLLGEKRQDEEGHYVIGNWRNLFYRPTSGPTTETNDKKERFLSHQNSGKFVRAPASDQVRIPADHSVFLEVTENNERVDGKPDPDEGLHGRKSKMFTQVYIPSNFRLRIFSFIFMIWAFTAAIGISCTILPLVIGRKVVSHALEDSSSVNDMYSFSIGFYITGACFFAIMNAHRSFDYVKRRFSVSPSRFVRQLAKSVISFLQLFYLSTAFVLLLPSLLALLTDLYILLPLHTYMTDDPSHVVHLVQDWTLGALYLRMAVRFISQHPNSRPARAVNAIIRHGWLKADVKLATRALIIPAILLSTVSLVAPLALGFFLNVTIYNGSSDDLQAQIYRYSYPITLFCALICWGAYTLRRQLETWRIHFRDEVYLIGEQLNNFDEDQTASMRPLVV